MVSAVNTGSVNMPKMLRHLSHRTNQVRDLVFVRDPIKRKDVKTTGQTSATKGSSTALAGPAVNFGYETGECKFYMPSMEYIRNTKEFKDIAAFDEIETFDKLIDAERIILPKGKVYEDVQSNPNPTDATNRGHNFNMPGYELDRFQFRLRSSTTATVDAFELSSTISGTTQYLIWECNTAIDTTEYDVFDFPVRNVKNGDTTSVYIDGTQHTLTASLSTASKSSGVNTSGAWDVDKMTGADSNNRFGRAAVVMTSEESIDMKAFGYKEAEWRVDSIKDYRDEYIEVRAVRIRGDRTSRRRAYG